MNAVKTINLPGGSIKVKKWVYNSDFKKIEHALKTIAASEAKPSDEPAKKQQKKTNS